MSAGVRLPSLVGQAGFAALAVLIVGMSPAPAQISPDGSGAPSPVKLVELIDRDYPMGQTADALAAPEAGAPALLRVREGAEVKVIGVTDGKGWYQIELPDRRLAYVEVSAIPAASGVPAPPGPATQAAAAPINNMQPVALAPVNTMQPSVDDGPAIDLPPTISFVAANDQLGVINPTAVYLAPNIRAPKAYPVAIGTMVDVVAKSTDGVWAWVTTADGTAAYIPLADMASPLGQAQ